MVTRKKPAPSVARPTRIRTAGFSVVRSPLLPADTFVPDVPCGPATLDARTTELFARVKQSPIWEALRITSPSLAKAIDAPRKGQERSAIANAVMRYLERMRGRATPFGLCAGYSLVPSALTSVLPIRLASTESYQGILRLDVDALLTAVRTTVVLDRDKRPAQAWCATHEIVFVADGARVSRRNANGTVSYSDIERSPELDQMLRVAAVKADWETCLDALLPFAPDREERESYLHQLIDLGILVPESYPSIATEDELLPLERANEPALRALVDKARAHRVGAISPSLVDVGDELDRMLKAFRQPNTGAPVTPATAAPSDELTCIYDLFKPVEAGAFGADVFKDASRVVMALQRFFTRRPDTRHEAFRKFLWDRYEGREVPLVEAHDSDYGFDFPLEANYAVDPASIERLAPWRLRLYARAIANGEREVVLTEETLPFAPSEEKAPAVPKGFALLTKIRVHGDSVVFVEPTIATSPGTQYFGRATSLSAELRDKTRAYIQEQYQGTDAHVAQLTYFLPGKSAAFVQYPTLTPFELVLSARPGEGEDQRIDINDILVSPKGERTELRSKKTGKRIIVLGTGAANPNRAMLTGVARFLLTLERDDYGGGFSWGNLLGAPFLPRVVFEGHTLYPMQWHLCAAQTLPLRDSATVEARWEAVQELRKTLGLPRHIRYTERGDNALPIDLDDVLSVEAWLSTAQEEMDIQEYALVNGVLGPEAYYHEIVMPFLVDTRGETSRVSEHGGYQPYDARDTFDAVSPGAHCLYLRIYGGRSGLIPLVCASIADVLLQERREGRIEHWFFLPFSDPDPHLRVRVFGEPSYLFGTLLPRMNGILEPLMRSRVAHKIEVGTYQRETYRYGGAVTTDLCEHIFCASSEAALMHHGRFDGDIGAASDLLVPLVGSVLSFARLLGLDVAAQRHLLVRAGESYTRTPDRMVPKRAAGEHFRQLRDRLVHKVDSEAVLGAEAAEHLHRALTALRVSCSEGKSKRAYEELCVDLLHVHSIRILTTWCEVPNLEAIAYFVAEKVLAAEAALSANS